MVDNRKIKIGFIIKLEGRGGHTLKTWKLKVVPSVAELRPKTEKLTSNDLFSVQKRSKRVS